MPLLQRLILAVALTLALANGAMAPGVMLAQGPGAGLEVVLCAAHGGGDALVLTPDGEWIAADEAPADPEQSNADPCPFAMAGASVVAASPAALVSHVAYAAHEAVFTADLVGVGQGLAAPPPPALGPPILI